MVFAGDVTLSKYFAHDVGDNFSYPFAYMHWFGEADITMVNLETPMTAGGTRQHKEFTFHGRPKYGGMLKDAGVDLVTLANNHIFDYGKDGLLDTIELLDSLGIQHVGAGMNIDSARSPVIIEVRGMSIGFLGYLDSIRTNNLHFATPVSGGPARWDTSYFLQDIAKLKAQTNFVVVNVHWGVEKSRSPFHRQRELAHRAIDAGADLIIGHHPHVLQGIERYRGKVIAYSLGNFLFGGNSLSSYSTAVLKISIPASSPADAQASVIPVGAHHWQLSELKGMPALRILNTIKSYSMWFPETIFQKQ